MPSPSPQLVNAVRKELVEGERLAWAMSPEPAAIEVTPRKKTKWDAVVILGGGYATLASIWMALRSGNWLWLAVPLSFLVLGALIYFASERVKERQLRAIESTVYVVTTKRALILSMFPERSLQQLEVAAISDVTVLNKREDFGDLRFSTASAPQAMLFRGVFEAARAHTQIMRVIRDPGGADQELAASERYMAAMNQLARRTR